MDGGIFFWGAFLLLPQGRYEGRRAAAQDGS